MLLGVTWNVLESEVLSYIKWKDLGYLYERRFAIEVIRVKQCFNRRLLPFFTFTKCKRNGVLLEVKRSLEEIASHTEGLWYGIHWTEQQGIWIS